MTPLEKVLLRVCFGGHHALADVIDVLARAVHGDRLAITCYRHQLAGLFQEQSDNLIVGCGHAQARDPFGSAAMKAAAGTAPHLTSQVSIRGHDDQVVRQGVLHEDLVVLGFDASVAGAAYPVAPTIQQVDHLLNHVLVGQER